VTKDRYGHTVATVPVSNLPFLVPMVSTRTAGQGGNLQPFSHGLSTACGTLSAALCLVRLTSNLPVSPSLSNIKGRPHFPVTMNSRYPTPFGRRKMASRLDMRHVTAGLNCHVDDRWTNLSYVKPRPHFCASGGSASKATRERPDGDCGLCRMPYRRGGFRRSRR
jgi:hypothetical protein